MLSRHRFYRLPLCSTNGYEDPKFGDLTDEIMQKEEHLIYMSTCIPKSAVPLPAAQVVLWNRPHDNLRGSKQHRTERPDECTRSW